jgi:hypothetical protein
LPSEPELLKTSSADASVALQQSIIASRRTTLAATLAQLRTDRGAQLESPPTCFVSYAWGDAEHETWVRDRLVPDLDQAGVDVILDRRDAVLGESIPRFVERIGSADWIIVVGTPSYLDKYNNRDAGHGTVVAAEVDLINQRLIGTEAQKLTVIPVLKEGTEDVSFPPLLRGRVRAELVDPNLYFLGVFDLALHLWGIRRDDEAFADLRRGLGAAKAD